MWISLKNWVPHLAHLVNLGMLLPPRPSDASWLLGLYIELVFFVGVSTNKHHFSEKKILEKQPGKKSPHFFLHGSYRSPAISRVLGSRPTRTLGGGGLERPCQGRLRLRWLNHHGDGAPNNYDWLYYITICNWNRTGTKQIQCITHRFLLVEILRLKPGFYHFI